LVAADAERARGQPRWGPRALLPLIEAEAEVEAFAETEAEAFTDAWNRS